MNNFINIKQYGFSEMFSKEIPQDSPLEPARVLSQEKGFYRIITDKGEKLAEVSGKFRYQATFSSEYPAVGDFVLVNLCCREKALLSEKQQENLNRNRLLLQISIRYFFAWH